MQAKTFWPEGVRFECQGTGRCCTSRGKYGYVYLSLEDRRRMAAHHGLRTSEFTRQFCDRTDGYYHLRHPERDCQFLIENRCTVYSARPTQCRTWPFWPENLNAKTWNQEVAGFCAGIGKGKLYKPEEIERILEEERHALDD